MARIPVYQEQQSVGQGMAVRNVSAPSMAGAGAMGQALQQVGAAIKDVASARLSVEEENAKAWVANASAESALQWTTRLKEMQENTEPGARNFTSNIAKEFDPWADKMVESAPSEMSRKFLQNSLVQLRQSLLTNAISFEATEGRNYRFSLLEQGINKSAQVAYADPTNDNLSRIIGEQTALIDSLNDTPTRKETLRNKLRLSIGRAGAESMATNNPQMLIDQFDEARKKKLTTSGNEYLDLLDPTEWDTYIRMANTTLAQGRALQKESLNRQLQDASAMATNGILDPNPPPKEAFIAAYGADGDRMYQSYQRTQSLAKNIGSMKSMPNDGIVAMIKSLEPKPGEGYAEGLQRQRIAAQAAQTIISQREDDPATYVANSSRKVSDAYNNLTLVLNNQDSTEDQRRQAASVFATTSIAEQQRLGIRNPRILSKQAVSQIQQQFFGSDDNELVSAKVKAMSDLWGANWPVVYGQLIQDKALPDSAIVIGSGMTGAGARNMAIASKIGLPQLLTGLPSTTKTDITERVTKDLESLRKTMIGSDGRQMTIGATETFNTFFNSTVTLAAYYHSQGMSINEASKKAADETVLSRYQFKETFRIPTLGINGRPTGFNANIIENNARFVLNNIKAEDLLIPESQRRDAFIGVDYVKNIKRRSYWINNEKDDGLVLMNADSMAPVLYKNGRPVQFRYQDLMLVDEYTPLENLMAP